MSEGSITQRSRQARPSLEGLEGRTLLSTQYTPSGVPIPDKYLPRYFVQKTAPVSVSDRRMECTTAQGAHVTVTLYGTGTLAGSSVDSNGALNLRFSGTNAFSGIVGKVTGGSGTAPLASLYDPDLSAGSTSTNGLGGTLINVVNLKGFDLVSGGLVNLTSGAHVLFLNSAASDSLIRLREAPSSLLPVGQTSFTSPPTGPTLTSSVPAAGTTTVTRNGVTLTIVTSTTGAQTLTNVSGTFTPGTNLSQITPTLRPGLKIAPPGIIASINDINGTGVGTLSSTPQSGAAVVTVLGNVQSFRSLSAQGLSLVDRGNLNLVKMQSLADSTISGAPFGHADIPKRTNVTILSTARTVDGRNGVTVV
jgi:hypothetical protein